MSGLYEKLQLSTSHTSHLQCALKMKGVMIFSKVRFSI